MKKVVVFLAAALLGNAAAAADVDWLIATSSAHATVTERCWPEYATATSAAPCGLELSNGLTSRRFLTNPAFGTIDWLLNATIDRGGLQSMLRSAAPEAMLRIDGVDYVVGGLRSTSMFRAYANRSMWLDTLAGPVAAEVNTTFAYAAHRVGAPVAPFPWTPGTRGSPTDVSWPPKGVTLEVDLKAPAQPSLTLTVYYELYDGAPILAKWLELKSSDASKDVIVDRSTVELFAAGAPYGAYIGHGSLPPGSDYNGATSAGTVSPRPLLHAKTDQAHGAFCEWVDDYQRSADPVPGCPECKDEGATEPLLNCSYALGPGAHVSASESFVSFRALLLASDSTELERTTLARHRITQLLAPHVTENPVFFHATDVSVEGFKRAVDQMAEVGFEMLIFSFGSGFQLETANKEYLSHIAQQVAYAKSKGIEVGGYDLICLDRGHGGYGGNVGDEWVTVDPTTGKLGLDACFASGWYDKLYDLVDHFINATGLSMLETDGPYGGAPCASKNHTHHHGLEDSIYRQTQMQNAFFGAMRARGVYINQPDNFFFSGGSRTGMGYDESQYSLPRWEDLSISRAGLYDDLYQHLPTQGWMFVPLVPYHAGGEVASFANHPQEYEFALATYLGAGTAACYRGDTLYAEGAQGDAMKATLQKWVQFYKMHRRTIIEPVVHLRRPDMQSWDGWLHVHPRSTDPEVGVALIFNPTDRPIQTTVVLPLYYCGIEDPQVMLSINEGPSYQASVGRSYDVRVQLTLPAKGVVTVVVSRAA